MGMAVRPPLEPRVLLDVARHKELPGTEHRSQQAVRAGQRPYGVPLFCAHAGRDEFGECASVVGPPQGGVPGIGQSASEVYDLLEDGVYG